jgi:peptide/nickel transport system ATP-binding protein
VAGTVGSAEAPVLEVRNLRKYFDIYSGVFGRKTGAIHAVEDVSFDLRHGETLALVGESGCGKSTTGRAITRLVEPGGGSVRLNGADFRRANRPCAANAPASRWCSRIRSPASIPA